MIRLPRRANGCLRRFGFLRRHCEAMSRSIADQMERLRYAGYTLEKDIALFADTSARFSKVRLYVLISSNLPADVFTLAAKCIAGGVDCLQLRAKDIDADKYFAIASEFVKMCKDAGVISIINDRADIAIASGADGVHLGQNDLPIEQARKLQMTADDFRQEHPFAYPA